jgi:hypothetical protein
MQILDARTIWTAAVMAEEPAEAPNWWEPVPQVDEPVDDGRKALTPGHSDGTRLVPHEFARSGLFGVFDPNAAREQTVNKTFDIYGGGTIEYKGPELRQDDRQVFFEVLYRERSTPGYAIIKPNSSLVNMGWSRNAESRKKLRACLERLVVALVTIKVPRLVDGELTMTHLLTKVKVLDDGSCRVHVDEDVRKLYDGNHYTQFVLEYEHKLERRSDLAKWLMLFYSTHHEPRPIPLTVLKELCNPKGDKYDFKEKVSAALKQLVKGGFFTEAGIAKKLQGRAGTEKVVVKRRHLPKFAK